MTPLRALPFPLRCTALAVLLTLAGCGSTGAPEVGPSNSAVSPTSSSPAVSSADASPSTATCRDPSKHCLGVLVPGSYASEFIDLFGTGNPKQVTYSVPRGWANTLDHQPGYWLRPAADYLADPGSDGNDTTSGIYIWGNVAAARQSTACAEASDPSVMSDATSLAAWMKGLRGLEAKTRPDTEISGHKAVVLDLTLNPTKSQRCSSGPFTPLLASRPNAPDAYMTGIGANESIRMMLIDLPGGHTAAVLIDSPTKQWPALLDASKPILATLQLTPGGN
jgi:predicted small lipoprotein YifL